MEFQSTPPARGATLPVFDIKVSAQKFQSTPPARGATAVIMVSPVYADISIHAPREGGDGDSSTGTGTQIPFQSTPPARGATAVQKAIISFIAYFNPRPPRGGRQENLYYTLA